MPAGETEKEPSGWTVDTLAAHLEALRRADIRFAEERDRRYAEVALEREKALKIKEEADSRALILQAETQKYKDEKANDLRTQIERERGTYVTQTEMKPIADWVTTQQGRGVGINDVRIWVFGLIAAVGGVIAIVIAFAR